RGERFAFLGPNGAGKTTVIHMLTTRLLPTAGSASVGGADCVREPERVRERIGLVFQERTLDEQLTVEENLRFHATLHGVPRAQRAARVREALAMVGLEGRGRDTVSTLSAGLQRRLEVARCLLHVPDVLFLDEPSLGLDPASRARLWRDLREIQQRHGMTVFFTTHYLDEADDADRIAIIHEGRIVATGTPAELKARSGGCTLELQAPDAQAVLEELRAAGHVAQPGDAEGAVVVHLQDPAEAPAALRAVRSKVAGLRLRGPDLDDVFLRLTGRRLEADARG
ncbi:MAG TPA: ABC transporter ATP-binding protein, partial [Candidatus Thermoplasmatota archaeon]|nr:ABC transporter ATP-binding protein [Candidatus Thermoplasmatota archaeon]